MTVRGGRPSLVWACLALGAAAATAAAADVSLNGYAEWRKRDILIVDGQRVLGGTSTRFEGRGDARSFATIPLGYEVKVQGVRLSNGVVLARRVEARPNGSALFEGDLGAAFDDVETKYREQGRVFDEGENGQRHDLGRLREDGRQVERARRITGRLAPPYLRPEDFRVYVVENQEWNAMAAPNRSIYVFSGLLEDMDDDEVAIVLGHEMVHATHEHSRKGYKKQIFVGLGALALGAAEQQIDSDAKRAGAQLATLLAAAALTNGYGRSQEDQADRVGLRYAYEGGFDVHRGPGLWKRFATKYGNPNKAVNFFFGDHSVAEARARNLERELRLNYAD
jgi:hypothetical protein